MAGSVNKVILVGNLGREPEVRRMSNGDPVVNLSVATSESWKDRNSGERKERTEWHRVVVFNPNLAKVAENYLHKGSKIYLEGQLTTRKYTDKDGIEKYSTEIVLNRFRGELVMLDARGQNSGGFGGPSDGGQGGGFGGGQDSGFGGGNQGGGFGGGNQGGQGGGFGGGMDDDIPF